MCEGKKLSKPCGECPFRRAAAPGYLGALTGQPAAFLEPFQWGGTHAPCHMTVDYESDDWLAEAETAPTCYGYLVYMRNQGQMPRNYMDAVDYRDVKADHELVFSNMKEFIEFHSMAWSTAGAML